MLSLPAGLRLIPGAEPIRIDPPGAKEAFLLLHGFTGMPNELAIPARVLSEAGFAVYAPRYPGHGTCRADFLSTRAEDWLRRAVDAYIELRSQYASVSVLGHSMGGLIATSLAASFDAPRLVLFAPAFSSTNRALAWAPLVAPFLPVLKKGRVFSSEPNPARQRRFEEYSSDDLVLPASQLRRLQLLARGLLPRVESKILVVQGGKDESVPPSVADWVARNAKGAASVDLRRLPDADHVFPFARDASKAAEMLKDWVAQN
jgi:carboxylesterase